MSNAVSILVIDGCAPYRERLRSRLTRDGYVVVTAADGRSGLMRLDHTAADLVILDVDLPDIDGYMLCQQLHDQRSIPLIVLTTRAREEDVIRGFEAGADAYVTKQISFDELLARVNMVLRRRQTVSADPGMMRAFADLTIDTARRTVAVRGREVHLSSREYQLLLHLALDAGRVVAHQDLLQRVWGHRFESRVDLLRAVIHRLRRKLEDDPVSPRYIVTRRGIGYLLVGSTVDH